MSQLTVTRTDRIATVELARPEKLNALSPDLLAELADVCESFRSDDDTRVVVLRGSGRSFSAGADLPEFTARFAAGDQDAADLGRRASAALRDIPQISIAAIHGHCVGGAIVLAACCDLRVAAASARFSIPEVDAGIPLAWGGMEHLFRLIGETRAIDLVLSCRPFDAAEAAQAGFLTEVIADDAFDEAIDALAEKTAARPKKVLRLMKSQITALREHRFNPRDDAGALLAARNDPEAQAIGAAYVESRIRKN